MAAKDTKQSIKFSPIGNGPTLAHHAGTVINGFMYIHGGINSSSSKIPSNSTYKLNISTGDWENITSNKSPCLSHHACVAIDNRYMIIIGGWNGKKRISDVAIFDTDEATWRFPATTGFNVGAGLSSHTASLLKNGDILVIGREGSLRMQRRAGNSWILRGSVVKGNYDYSFNPMGLSSRSGHSANFVATRWVIIGGRDDHLVEQHQGLKVLNGKETECSFVKQIIDNPILYKKCTKVPCGRKHHVTISCTGGLFLHGGETFDGRSKEPVGEIFLVKFEPSITFYSLGKSDIGLAGHICCTDGNFVIIHGGISAKNSVRGETYRLEYC